MSDLKAEQPEWSKELDRLREENERLRRERDDLFERGNDWRGQSTLMFDRAERAESNTAMLRETVKNQDALIKEQEAALATARRDAERYRWLCAKNETGDGLFHPAFAARDLAHWKTKGEIDLIIDRALAVRGLEQRDKYARELLASAQRAMSGESLTIKEQFLLAWEYLKLMNAAGLSQKGSVDASQAEPRPEPRSVSAAPQDNPTFSLQAVGAPTAPSSPPQVRTPESSISSTGSDAAVPAAGGDSDTAMVNKLAYDTGLRLDGDDTIEDFVVPADFARDLERVASGIVEALQTKGLKASGAPIEHCSN